MKKTFGFFVLLFICFQICKGQSSIPEKMTDKEIDSYLDSMKLSKPINDAVLGYSSMNTCEKLDVLDSLQKTCNPINCYNDIIGFIRMDIFLRTDKKATCDGRFTGCYYKNMEDYNNDMKEWRRILGCQVKKKRKCCKK